MTKTQQKVYEKMNVGRRYTSYDLGCSIATLKAMRKSGIIDSSASVGYLFSPRTAIHFWRNK